MDPAVRNPRDPSRATVFFVQGAITLLAVVFVWLALDDITTDNSTGFLPEYRLLTAAGAWGLFVAYSLLRKRLRALGLATVVAVAAGASVCFDGLGHKRDGGWSVFWPDYSVMLATWLWFLVLSFILFVLGRRAMPPGDVGRARDTSRRPPCRDSRTSRSSVKRAG